MSVSLTLEQVQSIIDDGSGGVLYEVKNTVVASENLTLFCFVFSVDTQAYSHPATVRDLETFPENRGDAVTAGLEYYRQPSATKSYALLVDAINFASVVRGRLRVLPEEVERVREDFDGTQEFTYTSE
jgi:hypothetical protein